MVVAVLGAEFVQLIVEVWKFIVCKMNTFIIISCLALTAVAQPQGYVYNPPGSGISLRLVPPSSASHHSFGVRISIQAFIINCNLVPILFLIICSQKSILYDEFYHEVRMNNFKIIISLIFNKIKFIQL